MNRKFLEDLGLEKDQINSIMEKHGEVIESHKKEVAEKDAKIGELEGNIKERDKDIENLKNATDKVSKEDYEALQNKYKDLEKESKANIDNVTKNFLIDKVLSNSKAKNVDILKKQIDMGKITLDGEVIKGLDEQIEALQKSDSYLFNIENETNPEINLGGTHTETTPSNDFNFGFIGVRENPLAQNNK